MGRPLRLLSTAEALRVFTYLLIEPFFALYLYRELGVPYFEIGLILLGVNIPALVAGLWGGFLADRVGRRPLIVASTALEAVGFAALAGSFLLSSLWGAVVSYAGVAAATGLGLPAVSAYVADSNLGSDRTRAFSGLRIADNAGAGAGVAAGGFLIATLGFFGVSVVGAFLLVATTGLLLGFLPSTSFDRNIRTRRRRSQLPEAPAAPQLPPPRPFRDSLRAVRRNRLFLIVATGFLFIGFFQAYYVSALPLYSNIVLGIPYWLLGLGLALNSVLVVVTQSATTTVRLGRSLTATALLGTAFYVASFLILGVGGERLLLPEVAFFVAMIVLTIGENLVEIPKRTLPSNMAPVSEVGAYNGVFRTIFQVGQSLSPLGVGVGFAVFSSPLELWSFFLIPAVPAIILLAYARGRIDRQADRA